MMNWLYYLLEANLYLSVFYGFYRLFLHQETFYTINRYVLIVSTLVSFTLPFIQIGWLSNLLTPNVSSGMEVTAAAPAQDNFFTALLPQLLMPLSIAYLLIATVFLIKMLISLAGIYQIYFRAKRYKSDGIVYVDLDSTQAAFSFFNILFINPDVTEKHTVLKHEMIHIEQRHSADILFFELLQMISWFNPVAYLMQQDIRLLHEYIADDLTTASTMQKHEYAMFLIENSFGVLPSKLSNQIFNQSLIKRRITMLNKQKSAGRAKLKLLLLAPIAITLLCTSTVAFSQIKKLPPPPPPVEPVQKTKAATKKETIPPPELEVVKFPPPIVTKNKTVPQPKVDQVKFPPPIVRKKRLPPPPPVEPAPAKKSSGTVEEPSRLIEGDPTPGQTAPLTLTNVSISPKAPEKTPAPAAITKIKITKANP